MTALDVWCTHTHYLDHVLPVWRKLPKHLRGTFYTKPDMVAEFKQRRVAKVQGAHKPPPGDNPMLTISHLTYMAALHAGRDIIAMEHGAGQMYVDDEGRIKKGGAYYLAGAPGVIAWLSPGERQAEHFAHHYPRTPIHIVGCPKLDPYINRELPQPDEAPPAISFHFNATTNPESRSAISAYRSQLPLLKDQFNILGHAHPRHARKAKYLYDRAGITYLPTFDQVLTQAGVYAIDSMSTLYEFAATGRPVVVLNHRRMRRQVEHGLRYWEYSDIGIQVDKPADLSDAIATTIKNPDHNRERREHIVSRMYSNLGTATQATVDTITGILSNA